MAEAVQTLGRFRLQRKIGTGAMGVVYEAVDPKLNRSVAIKTILKSQFDEEVAREYSVRFREEAQAAARLNHPNIVQVYDFGEEGDIAFIVMELIRGKDLKHCFDANMRFAPKDLVRMMGELLSALDYAHQAGVVHRDIKPGNVMLDVQSRVKLMDFGVARISDSERTHRTQLGTMVGTPAYMSPEQVQGLWVDHRSDLFSCGIVLYQFLTNQRPFTGGDWTLRKMIVHEDPPRPSQINSEISPEYDRVISRALAKAPEARYQSASEFARALQRVFEGKPAEEEGEGTVIMRRGADIAKAPGPQTVPTKAAPPTPTTPAAPAAGSHEVEVEFWRSIKDSDDPEDFELYLQQFPQGAYARLAERKITKLRRSTGSTGTGTGGATHTGTNTSTTAAEAQAQQLLDERNRQLADERAAREAAARQQLAKEAEERRVAEEHARQESEARAKREAVERLRREAEEKARLEAERVRRENEDKARREAEARSKREAEEKARREAEERARAEQERARLEAEAKAKREAEEKAHREAEERARQEQERARLEAEAKAKREAQEKARREEEERARQEAVAKAKREAEDKARQEAEERARQERERARLEAEAKAKREAEAKARRDADERARAERERAAQEAQAKAKREAEEKARQDAEAKAKRAAEEKARREADERARLERERVRQEAEAKAKRDADDKRRRDAEQRAREEAEERARRAPDQGGKGRTDETLTDGHSGRPEDEMQDFTVAPVRKPPNRMPVVVSGIAAVLIGGGIAAYFLTRSSPQAPVVTREPPQLAKIEPKAAEAPRAQPPQPIKPPPEPQADEKAKLQAREAEERVRREKLEAEQREKTRQLEEQKRREAKLAEDAKKREERAEEEKKRQAREREALAKAQEEKRRAEEAKNRELKKAEEEKSRLAEEAKKRAEEEKKRADEARKREEEEKKRAEEVRKREEAKAEQERKAKVDTADLFRRAGELESNGKVGEAVKLYTTAANANHGPSAKKLGDIFSGGKGDVSADYLLSLRWYQKARVLGESVPVQKGR